MNEVTLPSFAYCTVILLHVKVIFLANWTNKFYWSWLVRDWLLPPAPHILIIIIFSFVAFYFYLEWDISIAIHYVSFAFLMM
jgi:hypothetical protein